MKAVVGEEAMNDDDNVDLAKCITTVHFYRE